MPPMKPMGDRSGREEEEESSTTTRGISDTPDKINDGYGSPSSKHPHSGTGSTVTGAWHWTLKAAAEDGSNYNKCRRGGGGGESEQN